MTIPSVVALIVAGGSGTRAGGGIPKQYRAIAGVPAIARAVDAFGSIPVHVVIGAEHEAALAAALGDRRPAGIVTGGETRRASVRAGLESIDSAGGADVVLIHDAARPFLPQGLADRLIDAATDTGGAVPALPVVDTLVRTDDGRLLDVVPREGLVRVQTPQAFRFADILAAHRAWRGPIEPTDDAQVARLSGLSVTIIEGSTMLEKITHEADFAAAEVRLAANATVRVGSGYDVHAFAAGDHVILCGVPIAHDRALAGHSDADVGLHAITDALLGAIGDGDIGSHFPPSDPRWRGQDSAAFLAHAAGLVSAAGGTIDHVDATIICEAPKVGPHREAMRARVGAILQLPASRISIKATTTERLGFTGRGEGIAAQATATVRMPA